MRCISWNSAEGLLRYGNPDMLFLGTLKNKIHIPRFLAINMLNPVLLFWSRFPFNSKLANLAEIRQPWKFVYLFFLIFYQQMTYGYLFLSYMLQEQRWLCIGKAYFHLFHWLSVWGEKDENRLRLYKVIFVPRAYMVKTSSLMSFLGKI